MSEFDYISQKDKYCKGPQDFIRNEEILLDHLSIAVKMRRKKRLIRALFEEGFRRYNLKIGKPFR
jgi:hypothetical protein